MVAMARDAGLRRRQGKGGGPQTIATPTALRLQAMAWRTESAIPLPGRHDARRSVADPRKPRMTEVNPYSAPAAEIRHQAPVDGKIHKLGGLLMVPVGSELPEICLFTGRTGTGKYEDKKLVWASPWIFLLILVNWLILLIVYMIIRKQGRLRYYVDHAVLAKRRKVMLVSWLGAVLMVALLTTGIVCELPALIGLPILGLLILLIVGLMMTPKLKISRIDKVYIHLKGVPEQAMDGIIAAQAATAAV
jgi:hypothetical protein